MTTTTLTRRDFLKLGAGALGALAILEMGGATLLYAQPRRIDGAFGGIITAGPVDSFAPNSVTPFPDGRFYIVRTSDNGFLALSHRCTHLGCAVSWEPGQNQFYCPCHASTFDQQGDVLNTPAPRALDTFPIEIVDGQLQVNTAHAQTRDHYSPEQLVMAVS